MSGLFRDKETRGGALVNITTQIMLHSTYTAVCYAAGLPGHIVWLSIIMAFVVGIIKAALAEEYEQNNKKVRS